MKPRKKIERFAEEIKGNVGMMREGKTLESCLFLGTVREREKKYSCYYQPPPPYPTVTNDDCGYGSNAIWNNTSTQLSIHYALECICGGTSEGLLSALPLQPKFLSQ